MRFVNEYVPENDVKKYGLEEINKSNFKTDVIYEWTIDRERDIYLRWIKAGREEFCDIHDFSFYWKGTMILVRLKYSGDSVRGGNGWSSWELLQINMPKELNAIRNEILDDLKLALGEYKTFGIGSTVSEHTVTFKF